ncbi:hypothetical protein [Paenibacillus cremeus]|uniref:Uncharacterized protein n=1 Tax=Paenibacillus cremeus TaxID=2163881 RepID=A0A559K4H4_9BACL|nr:hypothetical protein [Paenibacillus cremeus]TVY07041.1 hypothetical protein FPZ49_26165 [Paenibacillus cremeus]
MKKWLVMGMAVLVLGGATGIAYATSSKSGSPAVSSISATQKQESVTAENENDGEVPDSIEQANAPQPTAALNEAQAGKSDSSSSQDNDQETNDD